MNHLISRKRAIGTGLVIGIFIGLVAMFSIRCGKEDPSSPVSFTPAPSPTFSSTTSSSGNNDPNPAPPAPAPAPGPDINSPAKLRYSYDVLSNDGLFRVEITSTGPTSGRVGVACYENPHKTIGERQIYSSSKVQTLPQGATRTPQTKIPQCVYWQCDGFEGDAIIGPAGEEIDVFYGRRFIVGRSGGPQGDNCSPPPECENPPCNPPPSCDLEQLAHDAAAECDENNFTLNVDACTFECNPPPQCDVKQLTIDANAACEFGVKSLDTIECTFDCNPKPPCEPHGEPECQEQTWDTNSCSWVGECVCEPTGEPECQEQTWNTQSCSWEGECVCDPTGEPECQEQVWDFDSCSWVGECVCEPTGEPECVEQTWSTDSCSWVGDCPEPDACIYEYGGPPADKEALCLALTDNSFWSDGSQHCVIPLPGISADKWNLTPGQSHPECLRKQDD